MLTKAHRGRDVVYARVVGEIQVVGEGRVLCSYCVYLLYNRIESHLLPRLANDELGGMHTLCNHFVLCTFSC
jgi:hypothetical protein